MLYCEIGECCLKGMMIVVETILKLVVYALTVAVSSSCVTIDEGEVVSNVHRVGLEGA